MLRCAGSRLPRAEGDPPRIKLLGACRVWLLEGGAGGGAAGDGCEGDLGGGDLARLNWRLGEIYADAVSKCAESVWGEGWRLVGCHGQTIYHQGAGCAISRE